MVFNRASDYTKNTRRLNKTPLYAMNIKGGFLMEQAHMHKIERLMEYDPEGCKCHKDGLDDPCKAKDLGLESFVECLEENPLECVSSFTFADSHYCYCPLRVYMANKLKK